MFCLGSTLCKQQCTQCAVCIVRWKAGVEMQIALYIVQGAGSVWCKEGNHRGLHIVQMQYIVQCRMQRKLLPWQVATTEDFISCKCNTLCSVGCKESYCPGRLQATRIATRELASAHCCLCHAICLILRILYITYICIANTCIYVTSIMFSTYCMFYSVQCEASTNDWGLQPENRTVATAVNTLHHIFFVWHCVYIIYISCILRFGFYAVYDAEQAAWIASWEAGTGTGHHSNLTQSPL